MRVIIFSSEKRSGVFGFTQDSAGANLPADHAPWRPLGGDVALATHNFDASLADPIGRGIARDGYCVVGPK
jgi:hypothetical protein